MTERRGARETFRWPGSLRGRRAVAVATALCALAALSAWPLWPRPGADAPTATAEAPVGRAALRAELGAVAEAAEGLARAGAGGPRRQREVNLRVESLLERALAASEPLAELEAEAVAALKAGRDSVDAMTAELDRILAEAGIEVSAPPPGTDEFVTELDAGTLRARGEELERSLEGMRATMDALAADPPAPEPR